MAAGEHERKDGRKGANEEREGAEGGPEAADSKSRP